MRIAVRYPSALLTAIVAGVYSAAVCALLVYDAAGRLSKIPNDEPQYLQVRRRLADRPDDRQLKEQFRQYDLQLRREYARQQRFTEVGVYLLLSGIAVTLASSRWAATLHRRLPRPELPVAGTDPDESASRAGLVAVGAVLLALLATAWTMHANQQTLLQRDYQSHEP